MCRAVYYIPCAASDRCVVRWFARTRQAIHPWPLFAPTNGHILYARTIAVLFLARGKNKTHVYVYIYILYIANFSLMFRLRAPRNFHLAPWRLNSYYCRFTCNNIKCSIRRGACVSCTHWYTNINESPSFARILMFHGVYNTKIIVDFFVVVCLTRIPHDLLNSDESILMGFDLFCF